METTLKYSTPSKSREERQTGRNLGGTQAPAARQEGASEKAPLVHNNYDLSTILS